MTSIVALKDDIGTIGVATYKQEEAIASFASTD